MQKRLKKRRKKLSNFSQFEEIKSRLHEFYSKGEFDLIKIYLSETIENDSTQIKFKINKLNRTASVFKINNNVSELIIPRIIKYESTEYLIAIDEEEENTSRCSTDREDSLLMKKKMSY